MNSYLLYLEQNGPPAINAIMPVAEVRMINMQLYTVKTETDPAELIAMMEKTGELKNYLIVKAENFGYRGDGQLASAARLLRS